MPCYAHCTQSLSYSWQTASQPPHRQKRKTSSVASHGIQPKQLWSQSNTSTCILWGTLRSTAYTDTFSVANSCLGLQVHQQNKPLNISIQYFENCVVHTHQQKDYNIHCRQKTNMNRALGTLVYTHSRVTFTPPWRPLEKTPLPRPPASIWALRTTSGTPMHLTSRHETVIAVQDEHCIISIIWFRLHCLFVITMDQWLK